MIRGIGCDVVKINRIRKLLESRYAERFLQKAFHQSEISDCRTVAGDLSAEKIAARWAAKEATYKALQLAEFSPRFPEMRVSKVGKIPTMILEGETLKVAES